MSSCSVITIFPDSNGMQGPREDNSLTFDGFPLAGRVLKIALRRPALTVFDTTWSYFTALTWYSCRLIVVEATMNSCKPYRKASAKLVQGQGGHNRIARQRRNHCRRSIPSEQWQNGNSSATWTEKKYLLRYIRNRAIRPMDHSWEENLVVGRRQSRPSTWVASLHKERFFLLWQSRIDGEPPHSGRFTVETGRCSLTTPANPNPQKQGK